MPCKTSSLYDSVAKNIETLLYYTPGTIFGKLAREVGYMPCKGKKGKKGKGK